MQASLTQAQNDLKVGNLYTSLLLIFARHIKALGSRENMVSLTTQLLEGRFDERRWKSHVEDLKP